jgi:hypothetical protein
MTAASILDHRTSVEDRSDTHVSDTRENTPGIDDLAGSDTPFF